MGRDIIDWLQRIRSLLRLPVTRRKAGVQLLRWHYRQSIRSHDRTKKSGIANSCFDRPLRREKDKEPDFLTVAQLRRLGLDSLIMKHLLSVVISLYWMIKRKKRSQA